RVERFDRTFGCGARSDGSSGIAGRSPGRVQGLASPAVEWQIISESEFEGALAGNRGRSAVISVSTVRNSGGRGREGAWFSVDLRDRIAEASDRTAEQRDGGGRVRSPEDKQDHQEQMEPAEANRGGSPRTDPRRPGICSDFRP